MFTVVYGLTSSARMFMNSSYNTGNNIFACTKGNEIFDSEHSLSLLELADVDKNSISRVVICSEFVSDIIISLIGIGFDIQNLYFFNHMNENLVSCTTQIIPKIDIDDVLYAFYDLACNLPCYDATTFVVLAEQQRIVEKKKYIQFVIVPDRSNKHLGINVYHSNDDASWRIEKIVKPLFYSIESCVGTHELLIKEQASLYKNQKISCYPIDYLENNRAVGSDFKAIKRFRELGVELSQLSPPNQAKLLVEQYISSISKGRKVITITFREYWANPEHRNNSIDDWILFLRKLDKAKYCPVVIRDTYYCTMPFPEDIENINYFPLASIDLHLRLALYQSAYINMGVESGPMYPISYLKNACSIIFRQVIEDIPNLSTRTNIMHGFTVGENHYFNDNDSQINVWGKDVFERISSEFERLVTRLEQK